VVKVAIGSMKILSRRIQVDRFYQKCMHVGELVCGEQKKKGVRGGEEEEAKRIFFKETAVQNPPFRVVVRLSALGGMGDGVVW
jgi:hypothetical protein